MENSAKKGQKTKRGRPPRHGAYSLLIKAGELPKNRAYIKKFLSAARAGLVADYGPNEEDLSTSQIIIIDRAISKMGILRCMEEYCKEDGVMRGANLTPCLRAAYLSYCNSLRLDLQALKDLAGKKGEEVLDPIQYAQEKYGKGKKDE